MITLFITLILVFILVFYSLSKAPLLEKRNPFIKESENFHY